MNVTASKLLLGVSLAAYGYTAWDHIFVPDTKTTAATKGKELTAGVVNHTVVLNLEQDPFNSVPLNAGSVHPGGTATASSGSRSGAPGSPAAPVAHGAPSTPGAPADPGKDLGDLKLDGVMVTVAKRVAVINGKAMREGDSMPSPGGAPIRAVRIGVGYCIVEGAGRRVILRVDDPQIAPGAITANTTTAQQKSQPPSWIDENQQSPAQMKQQIKDAPLPDALKQAMTQLFENER